MLKKIYIENELTIPNGTSPDLILEWANSIMRIRVFDYKLSHQNLGWLTKIHPIKIWKWEMGDLELMTDELKRIANILEINFNVYED